MLKGQYGYDQQGMESVTENNTLHEKVILPFATAMINEPVIFSNYVHLKLGHGINVLLKVWSWRYCLFKQEKSH